MQPHASIGEATMNMHPLIGVNRAHLVRLALAIGTSLGAAATQAGPDPFSGVSLDTSAKHVTIICSTCGTPTTTDDDTHRGGVGTNSVLYAASDPGWAVGASASFDSQGRRPAGAADGL